MKKKIINNDVFYSISWSPLYKYDKYEAIRVLPEMSGIIALLVADGPRFDYLLFYSCWRDGLRVGLKNLLDPLMTKNKLIIKDVDYDVLYYKYVVFDRDAKDMQDILYWLIMEYNPRYNDKNFKDSQRYTNIYLKEATLSTSN